MPNEQKNSSNEQQKKSLTHGLSWSCGRTPGPLACPSGPALDTET